MAAPNGTVWGSAVNDYGRLGIYKNISSTATTTSVTVEIWFWSKYSCSDSNNSLFFDNLSASGSATTSAGSPSISTTVNSGAGWSTSNQVKLKSYSYSYTRGTSAVTRYLYAKMHSVDRVGGTMYASTTFSVPALASYTVSYNANGGSGAPSSQTKWYGKSLTLSSTKPTRTGYTFAGWATSASGSVAYAAGASYTANAAVTLYAKWTANTYTVKYNANGGTGAPGNQTKTYGTALTLSSTKPTRTNYRFLGWATSASATTAAYAAGGSYTANAAVTLYAVWELAYSKPRIYNLRVTRCDGSGNYDDSGEYALVEFEFECDRDNVTGTAEWSAIAGGSGAIVLDMADSPVADVIGSLSAECSYAVTVTVTDELGSTSATTTLNGSIYPWDAKAGNDGIAFGKPAELGASDSLGGTGVADFAFDAKFNQPVYGNVFGLNKLPAIPANAELNNYITTGCWSIQSNAIAATITCGGKKLGTDDTVPPARAGRFEVSSSTGEGIRLEQWSYLRQRLLPYNDANPTWERDVARGEDNVWQFYDWWQSSLTPAAAEKVYSKAAMTMSLSANTTSSVTGAYTRIPLNKNVLSTSGRLTMESNSIRIGSNIQYVKVSGQMLLKCGSTSNNRHARIQKVSGSTTTSVAWSCVYGTASSNTAYPFTPIILSVKEGDLINVVYYTSDASDYIASGSAANGWQTYLTVEEL